MKTSNIPFDGLRGLTQNWRSDAMSGFLVFLLALPLSLGIAKASEFPASMGVLTAMIGGLFVAFFAGSPLTIKGPAAGLITVCAGAVMDFGGGIEGWHLACGAILVMAVIQFLLGVLKVGSLSDFFPHSVVHGMLAAIGILIFAKQFPVLLGVDSSLTKGLTPIELYTHIPQFIAHANPTIAVLGILCLVIIFALPLVKVSWIRKVPAPMVVLLVAIPLGIYDHLKTENPNALVKIGSFWDVISINASFAAIDTFLFWKYVFMFLFVNSLESLLTVKAIDGLDPFKRKSDYNQDLRGLALGNGLSALLGGLPMISEVARSSANVNFGGRTRWSNFFHGLFLLVAMLLLIPVIEMIPNAALAAMLISVAYRLASPKEFIGTYKIGPEQLVIFVVTIIVTVAEDLLLGVAAGIAVKFVFHIINGAPLRSLLKATYELTENEDGYVVRVKDSATFSNFLGYKKLMSTFKPGKQILFNFGEAKLVDHSFMEQLHHFEEDYEHTTGGKVTWNGLEKFSPYSNHPLAARRVSKDASFRMDFKLSPRQAALRALAAEHDSIFYPQKVRSVNKFKDFPVQKGNRIQYEENIVSGYDDFGKIEISDVTLTVGARQAGTDSIVTMLHVSDLDANIPEFALEPEHLLTKLSELSEGRDIDFSNHPVFSKQYYLRAPHEDEAKAFFSEQLIAFLESHDALHVESHKNKLLMYLKREQLTPDEINRMLEFAKEFLRAATVQTTEA